MTQDVQVCVNARLDFFTKYYSVPAPMVPEVDAFVHQLYELAERSANAMEFEQGFATELSARFNGLLPRLQPVAQQLTPQQQEQARQNYQQMRQERGESLADDVASEFADDVAMKMESEMIAGARKRMIEDGTFGQYTRATNAVEDAQYLGGFLGRLFKRKK